MNPKPSNVDNQAIVLIRQFLNLSLGISLYIGGISLLLSVIFGVVEHNVRLLYLTPILISGFLIGVVASAIRRLELSTGLARLIRILKDSEYAEQWSVHHREPDFPWRFPWGSILYPYRARRFTRFLNWLIFHSFTIGSQFAFLLLLLICGGLYGSLFLRLGFSPISFFIGPTGLGIADFLCWLLWGRHSVKVLVNS